MKKPMLLIGTALLVLCCAAPSFSQYNGQAGGMNPSGNSTFGGGSAGALSLNDYAAALRLMHQQQYQDAIPFLDNALLQRPHSADILTYLGYAHQKTGDLPGAFEFYQKALAINSDHKGAHQHLGEFYLAMHDLTSADAQLSDLAHLCADSCEEGEVLSQEIDSYRKNATTPETVTSALPAH